MQIPDDPIFSIDIIVHKNTVKAIISRKIYN